MKSEPFWKLGFLFISLKKFLKQILIEIIFFVWQKTDRFVVTFAFSNCHSFTIFKYFRFQNKIILICADYKISLQCFLKVAKWLNLQLTSKVWLREHKLEKWARRLENWKLWVEWSKMWKQTQPVITRCRKYVYLSLASFCKKKKKIRICFLSNFLHFLNWLRTCNWSLEVKQRYQPWNGWWTSREKTSLPFCSWAFIRQISFYMFLCLRVCLSLFFSDSLFLFLFVYFFSLSSS